MLKQKRYQKRKLDYPQINRHAQNKNICAKPSAKKAKA